MSPITIQVLEGAERGRVYSDLPSKFCIGRDLEHGISLSDDRVSRTHVKVQADGGVVILTDTGSTIGTRVNGIPVELRVLRKGDLIAVGDTVLLYGKLEEHDPTELRARSGRSTWLADNLPLTHLLEDFGTRGEFPRVTAAVDLGARAQLYEVFLSIHAQLIAVLHAGREGPPRPDNEESVSRITAAARDSPSST